jgi:hypothetical protein
MANPLLNLEHTIEAVAIQIVAAFVTGDWWTGAFSAIMFFSGREHAQAEYRWIEKYGSHHRANMPWWGGFDLRVWDVHSFWWNLLLSAAVVICLAYGITHQ